MVFGVEHRSQWAECVGLDLHTVLGFLCVCVCVYEHGVVEIAQHMKYAFVYK